jgi:hypothetical protein
MQKKHWHGDASIKKDKKGGVHFSPLSLYAWIKWSNNSANCNHNQARDIESSLQVPTPLSSKRGKTYIVPLPYCIIPPILLLIETSTTHKKNEKDSIVPFSTHKDIIITFPRPFLVILHPPLHPLSLPSPKHTSRPPSPSNY